MIAKLKYVYLVAVPSLILVLALGLPGTSKSAIAAVEKAGGQVIVNKPAVEEPAKA